MEEGTYRLIEGDVKSVETKKFSFLSPGGKVEGSFLEATIDSSSPVNQLVLGKDYDVQPEDTIRAYISLRSSAERGLPAPKPPEEPEEERVDSDAFSDRMHKQRLYELELRGHNERRTTLEEKETPFKVEVMRQGKVVAQYEDSTFF